MKNLKKFLAVLVVVAMMASLMVTASAAVPSDVKGTEYESAVTRLNALGIITGYPDGTFGPNDTITRAQFAAVVIRALGYTSAAAAQSTTKFADVPATYWASGYINLATTLGIIKGYPDGKFGPEDKVLYEQAITMIVRALGYEPAAAAQGGYPTGYMVIASQEDIDDDVAGAIGTPASRGIVAQLVDNSLEVALMEQVSYGSETKFEKTDPAKTLLADKLKLDKWGDAEVISVDTDDREIKVKYNDGDGLVTDTFEVFETLPMVGLEDAFITIWVKDDVIYNIDFDSTTLYDFIAEINGADDYAADDPFDGNASPDVGDIESIKLEVLDDDYDANEDATLEMTYEGNDVGNIEAGANTTDFDALIGSFAKVIINDGEIVKVEANALTEAGIITAVEDDAIEYTKADDEGKRIRDLDDADSMMVVVDGKVAEYSDLKADMYFDYHKDGDDYIFVASSAKLEGTLSKAKDDKIAIDGEYTDLAGTSYFSTDNGDGYDVVADADSFADLLKIAVVAYLDNHGDIKYIKGEGEDSTDTFYGFAVSVDTFDDKIKVTRSVDGDEDDVTYETDLDEGTATDALMSLTEVDDDIDTQSDRTDVFYKFTIDEDNVITKIEKITPVSDGVSANGFNEDGDYIDLANNDNVYVEDDTLIFDIGATDINVLTWADIEGMGFALGQVRAYYDDTDPDFILLDGTVGTPDVAFGSTDAYLGFVLESGREDSDYYAYKLAVNGDEKDFLVDEDERNGAGEAQVVVYKTTSTEGEVKIAAAADYENLGDLISASNSYTTDEDDGWATVTGQVYKDGVDGKYLSVTTSANYNAFTKYRVATDALIYKVDVAGSTDIDDYTEASLSDINDEEVADGTGAENDLVYGLVADGQIKILFIVEQ